MCRVNDYTFDDSVVQNLFSWEFKNRFSEEKLLEIFEEDEHIETSIFTCPIQLEPLLVCGTNKGRIFMFPTIYN